MTRRDPPPSQERVVRILDEKLAFRGTGTLLDDRGWVLTCGHVFRTLNIADGLGLNTKLTWSIQTSDCEVHECEYLAEKFDDEHQFDYALIKSKCIRFFRQPLVARRGIDTDKPAFMLGFSGPSPRLLRVDGRITGPSYSFASIQARPLLQLQWDNSGSYVGFSGAPIFVKESAVGVLLAGIQASELEAMQTQFGTPLPTIQSTSRVFSTTVATLTDLEYRRAGFRLQSVHDLSAHSGTEVTLAASDIVERIRRSVPHLVGQLSTKKLFSRLHHRICKGEQVVSVVICTRRPPGYLVRGHLAKRFRRRRWHQNMFAVMTESELRGLQKYREYVEVFLF